MPQRFSPTCSRRSVWPSLRRYPTAAAAARLGEKHLAAFLTQHGYSGRCAASVLLARLRSAPSGITDPALTGAVHDWCSLWFTVLQAVNAAGKNLDRSVITHLGEHPDSKIFT